MSRRLRCRYSRSPPKEVSEINWSLLPSDSSDGGAVHGRLLVSGGRLWGEKHADHMLRMLPARAPPTRGQSAEKESEVPSVWVAVLRISSAARCGCDHMDGVLEQVGLVGGEEKISGLVVDWMWSHMPRFASFASRMHEAPCAQGSSELRKLTRRSRGPVADGSIYNVALAIAEGWGARVRIGDSPPDERSPIFQAVHSALATLGTQDVFQICYTALLDV